MYYIMINCPCGFGKNLKDDQETCPYCGTDLKPLHQFNQLYLDYYNRGQNYYKSGKLNQALNNLLASLSIKDDFVQSNLLVAEIYFDKKAYKEVVLYTDKVITTDMENQEAIELKRKAIEVIKEQLTESIKTKRKLGRYNKLLIGVPIATLVMGFIFIILMSKVFFASEAQDIISIDEDNINAVIEVIDSTESPSTTAFKEEIHWNKIVQSIYENINTNSKLENCSIVIVPSGNQLYIAGKVEDDTQKELIISIVEKDISDITVDYHNLLISETIKEEQYQIYTIKSGDSLSTIASEFYGREDLWIFIFYANRDSISNPDRINVGDIILIPAIE